MLVTGYALHSLPGTRDTVRTVVEYQRLGFGEGDKFERERGVNIDTLVAYRTPFGWRLRSGLIWNWINQANALEKRWITVHDTASKHDN